MGASKVRRVAAAVQNNGCSTLPPTSEWEVLRFECGQGIGVIYRNKKGSLSFSADWVKDCFDAVIAGRHWPGFDLHKRRRKSKKRCKHSKRVAILMDRDGDRCFYCNEQFDDALKPTIEHLVPVSHGGPDNLKNVVLACSDCNQDMNNLSLPEKLKRLNSINA